jgi:hypothetical protein
LAAVASCADRVDTNDIGPTKVMFGFSTALALTYRGTVRGSHWTTPRRRGCLVC